MKQARLLWLRNGAILALWKDCWEEKRRVFGKAKAARRIFLRRRSKPRQSGKVFVGIGGKDAGFGIDHMADKVEGEVTT